MKGMSLDAIQHGELTDSIIFRRPLRELLFNFALKKAKESIEIRERFRLYRSRFYGVARSFYIKYGKELVSKTIIDSYLDIFYLSMEELENGHTAFKEIIKTRKEEYSKYRKQGGTTPRYMVNNDRYDPISVNVDHSLRSYT